MKKLILNTSTLALITLSLVYTGCKKEDEDTTNPVVTLNGSATTYWQQNKAYSDGGATATDDTDGSISPSSSGTVNTAVVGTYIITYTAEDEAGNEGSAVRTVYVVNFDGPYTNVSSGNTDTNANGNGPVANITAGSLSGTNALLLPNLGLYTNNLNATFDGTTVTVPSQPSNSGVAGDVISATGTITGTGTASSPIKITLQHTEKDAAGTTFNTGVTTYTHQ